MNAKSVPVGFRTRRNSASHVGRLEGALVPRGDVVVERLPPAHVDVAGRVAAEVVRRVGADQVDARVRDAGQELAAVAVPEGRAGRRRQRLGDRNGRFDHDRIVADPGHPRGADRPGDQRRTRRRGVSPDPRTRAARQTPPCHGRSSRDRHRDRGPRECWRVALGEGTPRIENGGSGDPPLDGGAKEDRASGSGRSLQALLEPLDLAGRVDDRLLAREERVAVRADVDAQLGAGGSHGPLGAAGSAVDLGLVILGMDVGLHDVLSSDVVRAGQWPSR